MSDDASSNGYLHRRYNVGASILRSCIQVRNDLEILPLCSPLSAFYGALKIVILGYLSLTTRALD